MVRGSTCPIPNITFTGNPFYLTSKKEKTDSLDLETDSRAHSEVWLIESFNLNSKPKKYFKLNTLLKNTFENKLSAAQKSEI